MTTRTYGGREFQVKTKVMPVSSISNDARYQRRRGDNPFIRGGDIARSVVARDSQKFDSNILCVEINGELLVVDGFGRSAALGILGWETVEVDILCSRNKEKDALFIALNANNTNRAERGFTIDEFSVNAVLMLQAGYSVQEIAGFQHCTVGTVQKRLLRGQALSDRDSRADVSRLKHFGHGNCAKAAAAKAVSSILRMDSDASYEDVCSRLSREFNVNLHVLAGDNDKQIVSLPTSLMEKDSEGQPTNVLVLFYISKPNADTSIGHRALEHVAGLMDLYLSQLNTVIYAEDLSAEDASLNARTIARFVQECRARRPKKAVA